MDSLFRESGRERTALRADCVPARINKVIPKLLIFIPAGILLNVAYCLVMTDKQVLALMVHFHPLYLLLAALLCIVPWFTGSLRLFTWSSFLRQPLAWRDAFWIAIMADLGAAIAPPMIGGGAVKVGMLMNRGLDTTGWRFFTFYLHTMLAAVLSLFFGLARNSKHGAMFCTAPLIHPSLNLPLEGGEG